MPAPGPVHNDGSPAFDAAATLDAWRARGQHRVDPVRFRFLEAMARRAAGHGGGARQLLDRRLAALIEAYGRAIEDRAAAQSAAPGAGAQDGRSEGLAALLAHIARHAPAAAAQPAAAGTALRAAPAAELKAVRLFKSTWSRLSADRRLTQSLAKVPENAGPLNSHHLVHRALVLMHELSPEYLNRFMSHVDALLWLEQMQGGAATPAAPNPPRAEGAQKKRAKS
jgi:hypothetical protein